MQAHIELPYEPLLKTSGYILWQLDKVDVGSIIERELLRHRTLSVPEPRRAGLGKETFHATTVQRYEPATPLRDGLVLLPQMPKRGRVLYHGVGRDLPGARLLERGGRHTVVQYDPFHPLKAVRRKPRGMFREVWSIYTLNVLTYDECYTVLREIHSYLTSDEQIGIDKVFAMIAVRRDLSRRYAFKD